jgi:hypothetical protein
MADERDGGRNEFGVVGRGATVRQRQDVLDTDAHVMSGVRTGGQDLPCPFTVAVPELWNSRGNQFGDSMRVVHPTVDLDQHPHDAVSKRTAGNSSASRRDARPASTLIPACTAARIIPPHPSSPRFTETKSGGVRQALTAAARANGS